MFLYRSKENKNYSRQCHKMSHVDLEHLIYGHIDDILVIADNHELTLNKINDHFLLKKSSIGKPSIYFGTDTRQIKDSQENI